MMDTETKGLINDLHNHLVQTDARVNALSKRIDDVRNDMVSINVRIDELNTRINARIDALDERIDINVNTIDKRIKTMGQRVSKNTCYRLAQSKIKSTITRPQFKI